MRPSTAPPLGADEQPHPDDLVGPPRADSVTPEANAAPSGADEAREGSQQRRLAGAIGADEGDDLAFIHGQRQPRSARICPYWNLKTFDLQQRRAHGKSSLPR